MKNFKVAEGHTVTHNEVEYKEGEVLELDPESDFAKAELSTGSIVEQPAE